ncbi:hypothetical protein SEA_EVAA_43 [Gordonia phage Evaa]|nr:hypothetical protein SEA_EVAA_43 [Gordonia phage Evaa]
MAGPFDKKGGTATKTAAPKAAPKAEEKAKPEVETGDGFDTAAEDGGVTQGKAGDPFSLPPSPSDYRIQDFVGELLLVKPTEYIEEMHTENGTTDVVRVDMVPLSGEVEGQLCEDILVFQMALKRALLKVMDGPNPFLLGRLEMGKKKPGKNAPYIFSQPEADDVAKARAYLASA